MKRWLALVAVVLFAAAPVQAAGLTGHYLESRTCDVWTGPCFANAETSLGGKHAVLAWKVQEGALDNVRLDGLGVVAVIETSDTLGLDQTGPGKALIIVDKKANAAQKAALVRLAKQQGGNPIGNVIAVESAAVELTVCRCEGNGCYILKAGAAKVETRCLDAHAKVCGNESAFYPPLAKGVNARPALTAEHSFTSNVFNETWKETDRRGSYVGSFELR